ncbi:hypothetical protein PO909_000382 [Leuciscus waleckii]
MAMLVAQKNFPFAFCDDFTASVAGMFPDSAIARKYSSGKTKTTQLIKDLRKYCIFCVQVEGSKTKKPIEEKNNSKPVGHADMIKTHVPSHSSHSDIDPNLSIVLFGNSSSVQFGHGNIVLGEQKTNIENAEISKIVAVQQKISERHVSVINMIDLHEAELYLESVDHHIDQLVNENEISAFIFVVRLGQLTDADKMGLEWLQRVFGDRVLQFVMILFTYEREEECDSIIDDLKKNPVLEQLLEKCGGRYHICNKMMNNQSEMRDLMKKIEHLFNENNQQRYTGERRETEEPQKSECEGGKKNRFLILISHD